MLMLLRWMLVQGTLSLQSNSIALLSDDVPQILLNVTSLISTAFPFNQSRKKPNIQKYLRANSLPSNSTKRYKEPLN